MATRLRRLEEWLYGIEPPKYSSSYFQGTFNLLNSPFAIEIGNMSNEDTSYGQTLRTPSDGISDAIAAGPAGPTPAADRRPPPPLLGPHQATVESESGDVLMTEAPPSSQRLFSRDEVAELIQRATALALREYDNAGLSRDPQGPPPLPPRPSRYAEDAFMPSERDSYVKVDHHTFNRQYQVPEKFSGKPAEYDNWCTQVHRYVQAEQRYFQRAWAPIDEIAFAGSRLNSENQAQWITEEERTRERHPGSIACTLEAFLRHFQGRIGNLKTEDEKVQDYLKIRQTTSVKQFIRDIQLAASKLKPPPAEYGLRQQIILGLKPHVSKYLRTTPRSQIPTAYEEFLAWITGIDDSEYAAHAARKRGRLAAIPGEEHEDDWEEEGDAEDQGQLNATPGSYRGRGSRGNRWTRGRGRGGRQSGSAQKRTCWTCNEEGHLSTDPKFHPQDGDKPGKATDQ
jgi:hypothetical protein